MGNEPVKALVGSIQKFSTEDGPGIRTTVFLKGCPLRCRWCHNPELIAFSQQLIQRPNNCIHCGHCVTQCPHGALIVTPDGQIAVDRDKCQSCFVCVSACVAEALCKVAQEMTPREVMDQVVQDKGFYGHTGGGMTISGGELLSHPEFVSQLLDLAGEEGIGTCLDTCGFGDGDLLLSLARQETVTHVLYDMKALDDDVHLRCTGQSNALILENLRRLCADEAVRPKVWMRMPLIRGLNDDMDMLRTTADLYRDLGLRRLTLLPYHSLGVVKLRNLGGDPEAFSPPDARQVKEIADLFADRAHMDVEVLGQAKK